MASLMEKYPPSDRLEWNRDRDNYEVLKRADILISDFSGVIFDFALVYDKPVIYTTTGYKSDPYDNWWLGGMPWTFRVLPSIGIKLNAKNFAHLEQVIEKCLKDTRFQKGRDDLRAETWEYIGHGAIRAADYLEKKYHSLREPAQPNARIQRPPARSNARTQRPSQPKDARTQREQGQPTTLPPLQKPAAKGQVRS